MVRADIVTSKLSDLGARIARGGRLTLRAWSTP